MEQELQNKTEDGAREASFGGSRLRMEFENMEEKKNRSKKRSLETVLFTVMFAAAILMVTMVLIGIGAELL